MHAHQVAIFIFFWMAQVLAPNRYPIIGYFLNSCMGKSSTSEIDT